MKKVTEKEVLKVWASKKYATHKDLAEKHFEMSSSNFKYHIDLLGLTLTKDCDACQKPFKPSGQNKRCSVKCRKLKIKENASKHSKAKNKVANTCKTCGTTFNVKPRGGRFSSSKSIFCSEECHLRDRRTKQKGVYKETRRKYQQKWYKEQGLEYGLSWRKANQDSINTNQRKRRTGEYGYAYKKREEAIKKGYRSGYEQTICEGLLSEGVAFEYETLVLPWKDHKEHKYTPDLIFTKKDGSLLIVELKGYLDANTKRKMINVKKSHPDLDIRLVFQNPKTKLSKKSKATYGDWATKQGYLWCGPKINEDWLNE